MSTHGHNPLIFDRDTKITHWRKHSMTSNAGKSWVFACGRISFLSLAFEYPSRVWKCLLGIWCPSLSLKSSHPLCLQIQGVSLLLFPLQFLDSHFQTVSLLPHAIFYTFHSWLFILFTMSHHLHHACSWI